MTTLLTIIAACGHATCPSRESCLRWVIGRRMDDYQSFGSFQPRGGKCKFYRWTSERVDVNTNDDTRIVRVIMDISVALAKQCAAHDKDAEEHCSKLLKLAINEALRLHNDNNDNGNKEN